VYIRLISLILFLMGLTSSVVLAGILPDTAIQHEAITHFIADIRLVLDAQLNDTKGVDEARCYFKTELDENYLYVSMNHLSGDSYQCSLPALKSGSETLEYFFLIVNGSSQVIRSTPYVTKEVGNNVEPREQLPVVSSIMYVYSELGDIEKDDTSIIDGQVELVTTQYPDQLYGMRSGLYESAVIPDSLDYMPGYFGGFVLDSVNSTMRPVQGFAVNITEPLSTSEYPVDIIPKSNDLQLETSECPDIAGDDWSGYFTRTDSPYKEYLSAVILQTDDCHITIETTLSGLGHFLAGYINSNGDMLVYDSYDGEDWTTYAGPATSTEVGIYDYIYHPLPDEPEPPLNKISLYRVPQPPAEIHASDGTFMNDKVAVNWNTSESATSYAVYACNTSLSDSCTFLAQVNTNQYDDTRKVAGIIFYRIQACNSYGCGEFSDYDTGYHLLSIPPLLRLLL